MHHPLKNALPIVAAAYGDKFGVEVLIQGQQAYTDGQRIVIPAADPDDPAYQQIAWGYLAHETAHIRHTDFDVVATSADSPLRKALLNIIEDVRIEAALAEDYPGTRRTIQAVLKYLVDHGQLTVSADASPAALLQSWLLLRLRSRVLGQTLLEPLYKATDVQIRRLLSSDLLSRLDAITAAIVGLASTADALRVADAIVQLLEEEAEKAQPNPATKAQPADPQETTPDTSTHAEENDLAAQDQSPQYGVQTEESDTASTDKTCSVVQQILAASDADGAEDLFAQVASVLNVDAQQRPAPTTPLNLPKAEPAQPGDPSILQRAAGESARIRARLRGLVQSSQDNRPHAKHQGQRIAHNRLARSQAGESRLFLSHHPRVAPNAAVHLLVDVSGSMAKTVSDNNRKYSQIANEAALALALALEGIPNVSTAVSFFPGHTEDVATALWPHQSVRQHAARFAQTPRGCTPLAPALWFAANDLLKQKEKRKLMIVLTDGEPDDSAATNDIIDRCNRSGFELLGIGIQTRSVERFFPSSLVINDLKDLKRELFNVTKNLLLTP